MVLPVELGLKLLLPLIKMILQYIIAGAKQSFLEKECLCGLVNCARLRAEAKSIIFLKP